MSYLQSTEVHFLHYSRKSHQSWWVWAVDECTLSRLNDSPVIRDGNELHKDCTVLPVSFGWVHRLRRVSHLQLSFIRKSPRFLFVNCSGFNPNVEEWHTICNIHFVFNLASKDDPKLVMYYPPLLSMSILYKYGIKEQVPCVATIFFNQSLPTFWTWWVLVMQLFQIAPYFANPSQWCYWLCCMVYLGYVFNKRKKVKDNLFTHGYVIALYIIVRTQEK